MCICIAEQIKYALSNGFLGSEGAEKKHFYFLGEVLVRMRKNGRILSRETFEPKSTVRAIHSFRKQDSHVDLPFFFFIKE